MSSNATPDRTRRESDDMEVRFRLNTDSYEADAVEPIPDLEGGGSSFPNSKGNEELTRSSVANGTEHTTIVNRMSTFEYLWRAHIRSRTNNPTVQGMLDRLLVVFLFLASIVEQPLMYILGNNKQSASDTLKKTQQTQIIRGTMKTNLGVIAYRISQGRNPKKCPIFCFHNPETRSSDEYVEILPLLAETGRRVVAVDLPGHGWSENPKRSCTIDDIASAIILVADKLLVEQFVCLGSMAGSAISISLASRFPARIRGCIHVNILYNPSNKSAIPPLSDLEYFVDGSHLVSLHNKFKFLDPDLSLRCFESSLTREINRRARTLDRITMEDLSHFDIESVAGRIKCPTFCVSGESAMANLNARGLGGTQRFDSACRMFPHCQVDHFEGPTSTAFMMNQAPRELSSLFAGFLDKHSL